MVKAASPTSPQLAAAARWRHGAPPPKAVAACTLVPMRPSWPGPVKLRHVTPGGTTTAPRVPKWNASWLICCAASMAVAALGCVVSPKSPPISPYWLPLSTWPAWLSSGSCARRAAGRCNRPKRRRWVHARLLLAWPLVPLPGPDRSPSQHRPRFPGTCLGSYPHPDSLLDTSLLESQRGGDQSGRNADHDHGYTHDDQRLLGEHPADHHQGGQADGRQRQEQRAGRAGAHAEAAHGADD